MVERLIGKRKRAAEGWPLILDWGLSGASHRTGLRVPALDSSRALPARGSFQEKALSSQIARAES